MDRSVDQQLDRIERKSLKAALTREPEPLNCLEAPAAAAIVTALERAGLSQKAAAIEMGISEAQFTRQLRGQEHVSWQRLFKLPVAFWRELIVVMAEVKQLARVSRRVVLKVS
jgi:hypothetical protein